MSRTETESIMRFAGSFCVVFLLYFVHVSETAPASYEDISEGFEMNEVGPSALAAIDSKPTERPVKYVSAIVRNKRNFDYSDDSSSSEENRNFGYYNKRHHGFGLRWQPFSSLPPQPTVYTYWTKGYFPYQHGRPYHYHNHHQHNRKCKYPYDHSAEYDSSYSGDSEYPDNSSTEKDPPDNVDNMPSSTSIPPTQKTPPDLDVPLTSSTTTSTTTTTTTSTEFPFIDVRSSN